MLYMTFYALGRFVLSFWRVNDDYLWGLQQVQVVGLFIMIISVPIMVYLIKTRHKYEGYT
jgi:prolipoprotein diacylglyceryltransferase